MRSSRPFVPAAVVARFLGCWKKRIIKKLFRHDPRGPYMSYEEMEIIAGLLKTRKPKACLEWGMGISTLYFQKFLAPQATWTSVEHEKAWYEQVKKINRGGKVRLLLAPPNRFPWTDEHSDGALSDLKDYVEAPGGGPYDFILIDGRARAACLEKARRILSTDGIVVLHDAERKYYHGAAASFKYGAFLKDYDGHGRELWIGSESEEIGRIFDADSYKKLWEVYRRLGKMRIFGKKIFW